jgi:hypothetical protein
MGSVPNISRATAAIFDALDAMVSRLDAPRTVSVQCFFLGFGCGGDGVFCVLGALN